MNDVKETQTRNNESTADVVKSKENGHKEDKHQWFDVSACERNDVYKYAHFLSSYTPLKIAEELNTRIVGQEKLTMSVANFLYYHALRQIEPDLPPRPMMISGPSGSGKTEVWRVAEKLFKNIFQIRVVDGASMTNDGWKGDNKLLSHIDAEFSNGGILVVDEFDKLAKPKHDAGGSNVASQMQAEFLKLLEGELTKQDKQTQTMYIPQQFLTPGFMFPQTQSKQQNKINTKLMGIVLVGAFEDIKAVQQENIGFQKKSVPILDQFEITDDEYIEFGVLPELVGRISLKITTNQLTEDEYIQIIHNPYSRVSRILNVLKKYNVDEIALIDDEEIKGWIKYSKSNRTGVRWVSAQVENKILQSIMINGIGELKELRFLKPSTTINDLVNNCIQPIDKQVENDDDSAKTNDKEDDFFW